MALISISGHLKDSQGNPLASTDVEFQLVNYAPNLPTVTGTNVLVPVSTTLTTDVNGFYSGSIQGNDTISPASTLYQVSFGPGAVAIYNLIGVGPLDLDTYPPVSVIPVPVGPVPINILTSDNIFSGTNTFLGNETHSGVGLFKNINKILYADQFSGVDIGAQINAAYAALPANGGVIVVPRKTDGTSYQFSTPIVFNTVNKYVILQGGAPACGSNSDPGGTTLYYTPTTATAALTLDWTPAAGGAYTPGAGLRDITIINTNSPVTGGSGSSATGVKIGGTNGGAHCAEFHNVKITSFENGIDVVDTTGSTWGMVFTNLSLAYNTVGYLQAQQLELVTFHNSKIAVNGTGLKFMAGSIGDVNVFGGSIDSNTVAGVDTTSCTNRFNFYGTHWENFNQPGDVLFIIGGSAAVSIFGGLALDDNSTGNSGPWFTASVFYVSGLELYSAGQGLTGTLFGVNNRAYISVLDSTTTAIPLTSIAFAGSGTYIEAISPGNAPKIISSANASLGTLAVSQLNSIIFIDGVIYTTLASAYAALPATGGTVIVPANYTETMGASLTMSKPNSGFIFMGPAAITMGSYQVIVPAATHGIFFDGQVVMGGAFTTQGAIFSYSGSGKAFQIGTSSAATRAFRWNNVAVNLTGGAIGAASALYLANVIYFDIQNFASANNSSSTTTTGLVCDGTGLFCGNGRIGNPQIINHKTGILGTGTGGAAGMNAVEISGDQRIDNPAAVSGAIGIDLEVANDNIILSADIESQAIALKLGSGATGNVGIFRSEGNTSDVTTIAGSANNRIQVQTAGGSAAVVVTDAGTNNHISRAIDGSFDEMKIGGTFRSINVTTGQTVINDTASTAQKFIELANTGNAGFYTGVEGSADGGFFTGSKAYEAVLTSPNDLYVRMPVARFSGAVLVEGATPTGTGTQLGLGNSTGFGNGSAGTAVTTTTKSTGSGPATPQTVVKYLEIDIGGAKYWLPLVQ